MPTNITKMCTSCKNIKPVTKEYFEQIKRNEKIYYVNVCNACKNARRRKNNKRNLLQTEKERECGACGMVKSLEDFGFKNRDKGTYQSKCKLCVTSYSKEHYESNKVKRQEQVREYKKNNPDKVKLSREKAKQVKRHYGYGLDDEKFEYLTNLYDNKCHICRIREATHIDHDHSCCSGTKSCGKCVRGILCHNCNTMLGQYSDDIHFLQEALNYLDDNLTHEHVGKYF